MKKLQADPNAKDYNDIRDVLARRDVDAAHIATGDHWHVPISLAAAHMRLTCSNVGLMRRAWAYGNEFLT